MKRILSAALIVFALLPNLRIKAISAGAYTVIEQSSGRILYSSNGSTEMPMASTTKVMTALLTVENLDLTKTYDIPDSAVGIEGSSIYLKKGEKLTGEELLYGLMLASGNDAAYALAEIISGSAEEFVELMNRRAGELGLKNTHFADPCGLKSKNHYTTSDDLARLCAFAMKNETFCRVVSTQNHQISGANEGETRYLHNKNRILGEFAGGNGIKTGYTLAAGRCLCASAKRGDMQLICVVLNDREWFYDCETLLDRGFDEFSYVCLAKKGEIAGKANILDGKSPKCDIMYANDVFYPVKQGENIKGVSRAGMLTAPINKGEQAGVCEFFLDGKVIASVPLVTDESIERKFNLFGR